MIHLDSSFVIDLIREQTRQPGKATAWLSDHAADPLGVSLFVMCELEAGAAAADDPEHERGRIGAALHVIPRVLPDARFASKYGALLYALQQRGRIIGDMDLLIATTALVEDASLVTGNEKHFEAVPDLRVLSYR